MTIDMSSAGVKGLSSLIKKSLFAAAMFLGSGTVMVLSAELIVRFSHPEPVLFPRWAYSKEYGLVLPRNKKMIHYLPGKWKFVYSINGDGNRGESTPAATTNGKKSILILGDSYSMGAGVNDRQEYPAIMNQLLGDQFQVINTGVGGWGLTQQIRRYYEYGQRFQPSLVVLQYCANDPVDNLRDRVTKVHDGNFIFQPTGRQDSPMRRFIRTSWCIQNSQLYRFLVTIYTASRDHDAARSETADSMPLSGETDPKDISREERFYIQLLSAFADDLRRHGVPFWFISVNGALDDYYPAIKKAVMELDRTESLDFVDVRPWLARERNYNSPEGHLWGVKAHSIIGKELSDLIRKRILPASPDRRIP